MASAPLRDFTSIEALRAAGFLDFVPLVSIDVSAVPKEPGLYVVVRPTMDAPRFLEVSAGGRFKGRDPSVPVARLEARWLADTPVVYIGKAGGGTSQEHLAGRIKAYRRFCNGEPVAHWGGRMICQLADLSELLIGWRPSDGSVKTEDTAAIDEFSAQYGQYPFANLRR